MKSLVILISGRGSNMQAIVAAAQSGQLPARIAAVIANRPDSKGLAWAKAQGIETQVLDHRQFASRDAFDRALSAAIDAYAPDAIALAGFMRVLTEGFVRRYEGRMLNIHPSLLPAFPGLTTHREALASGVKLHGCTVHFVSAEVDRGPIIIQAAVPVLPQDDEDSLAERVLAQEHRIYPQALQWLLEDRLVVSGACVRVKDGSSAARSAPSSVLISG